MLFQRKQREFIVKGEAASHKSSGFMKQQARILFSSKVLEKMDGF